MSERPLAGLRVLVTRPEAQASGMMEALRAAGAEPVAFPATRIEPPSDGGQSLRAAVRELGRFDWVVVTSANGAERLGQAAAAEGVSLNTGARFACVGPATANALKAHGVEVAVVAERHLAEGVLAALPIAELKGARVLLPLAAGARRLLADGLRRAGADVVVVEAYRSVADARGAEDVRERLDRGEIDVVTLTAPSTAERFVESVGADAGGAVIAAIGPVTAEAALALGLQPTLVAVQHTTAGLIGALIEHFENPGRTKQP